MTETRPEVLAVYGFRDDLLMHGGDSYERMLLEVLDERFRLRTHAIVIKRGTAKKYARIPLEAWRLGLALKAHDDCSIVIETVDASLFPVRRSQKRIVIVHHLGFSSNRLYGSLESFLVGRLRSAECVVTVSEYWREELVRRGFTNVHLIHNGFHLEDFEILDAECTEFLANYRFDRRSLVYVGNSGHNKGTERVIECLRGLNVQMVTSGAGADSGGVRNVRLLRRDYLRLLRSCALVITMSEFDEGWCRTAHEAMLCGTPVIGSGRGGMRELLEGGRQTICETFDSLQGATADLLADPQARSAQGLKGRAFARRFDYYRFSNSWTGLVDDLCGVSGIAA